MNTLLDVFSFVFFVHFIALNTLIPMSTTNPIYHSILLSWKSELESKFHLLEQEEAEAFEDSAEIEQLEYDEVLFYRYDPLYQEKKQYFTTWKGKNHLKI